MTDKQKVPGTTSPPKPNREQRRHPERFEHPENEPLSRSTEPQPELLEQGSQDVHVTSGHGKKTADKWNQ